MSHEHDSTQPRELPGIADTGLTQDTGQTQNVTVGPPKCENCGATGHLLQPFPVEGAIRFWRCTQCGLYQKACPVGALRYAEEYHAGYARARRRKRLTAAARLNQLAACVSETRPRLLDVGCSVGATLEAARDRGWQAFGVDVSRDAVTHCRDLGLNCLEYDGFTLPFPSNFFHLVTAWHVIEHVPSVRLALKEYHRVLATGGVLALETPSADCWKARLLGARYTKFWPDEHTYTFARSNLESLLLDAHFELLSEPWIGPLTSVRLSLIAYAAGRSFLLTPGRWLRLSKSFVIISRKPKLSGGSPWNLVD